MPDEPNAALEVSDAPEAQISFYVPEGMLAIYSDSAIVMHTAHEFILSFFQLEHPALHSRGETVTAENPKGRCVSRLIISPAQMQTLIQALTANYEKYSAKQVKDKDEA